MASTSLILLNLRHCVSPHGAFANKPLKFPPEAAGHMTDLPYAAAAVTPPARRRLPLLLNCHPVSSEWTADLWPQATVFAVSALHNADPVKPLLGGSALRWATYREHQEYRDDATLWGPFVLCFLCFLSDLCTRCDWCVWVDDVLDVSNWIHFGTCWPAYPQDHISAHFGSNYRVSTLVIESTGTS